MLHAVKTGNGSRAGPRPTAEHLPAAPGAEGHQAFPLAVAIYNKLALPTATCFFALLLR